ncbi:DciA family protein [Rhodoferax sp.]|uniref:DciA family protein n=1 Tax=Rhodoferax sp. TaxID=50421 RepID=UPI0025EC318F|nr:DciA family protein [Rhodoferax sp.]
MIRNHRSITALQAAHESPTLSHLAALAKESSARLQSLQGVIPSPLLRYIKAGPIEGSTWCLLLENNAVAAKLRQLMPALQAHLRSKGWEVTSIRLKVQMSSQANYR